METWEDIEGYEGLYQVSNTGRVKSMPRSWMIRNNPQWHGEIILKPHPNKAGYKRLVFSKNLKLKSFAVARLVAAAFIPNPENKPFVNHINGIPKDNRVENLEWCTQSENMIHSYKVLGQKNGMKGKFGALCPNSKRVIAIFKDGTQAEYESITIAANELKLQTPNICKVIKGVRRHTRNIFFKYA